jgi:hypothetical protein
MMRVPVRSSTLVSVGYDTERQTLEIEFQRRTVYQYFDVPKFLHDELMTATSKGRFFDQKIREKFRTLKVS